MEHREEAHNCVCDVQQGYETRHVTAAVGYKAELAYIQANEDITQTAIIASLSCAWDALPVPEVCTRGFVYLLAELGSDPGTHTNPQAASVMHSVLVRGIDTGTISMCGCFGQTLRVPIVPLDYLCDFFKSDEVRVFKISRAVTHEANGQHCDGVD
jgi:hypothetical protein